MKLKECMIAWNPNSDQVMIGPHPDVTGWSNRYQSTAGACYSHVHSLNEEQRQLYVYVKAVHLIVRDGVDPNAVHKAFSQIEEYEDGFISDLPSMLRNLY